VSDIYTRLATLSCISTPLDGLASVFIRRKVTPYTLITAERVHNIHSFRFWHSTVGALARS
jgi:hypothetical protein